MLSKLFHRNKFANDLAVPYEEDADPTREKQVNAATDSDRASAERPAEDVQFGVRKVEAVTLIWTRRELVFAYAW